MKAKQKLRVGQDVMNGKAQEQEHKRRMKQLRPGRKPIPAEEQRRANLVSFGLTRDEAGLLALSAELMNMKPNALARKVVLDFVNTAAVK